MTKQKTLMGTTELVAFSVTLVFFQYFVKEKCYETITFNDKQKMLSLQQKLLKG